MSPIVILINQSKTMYVHGYFFLQIFPEFRPNNINIMKP